jgi:prephenate dehydratase
MPSIAYLGPQGTFTEQAALAFAGAASLEPVGTVPHALNAVRAKESDLACVPVENSVEGAVTATMDALASDEPLVAIAEIVLPIRFSILVRPDTAEIRTVASHPHALAQVDHWLTEHLPAATRLATTSTAAAAAGVAAGQYDAAVSAPVAAKHYPLRVLADGVADVPDAVTRFLILSRPGTLPTPTGSDRTSLVAIPRTSRTRVLAEMLTELALRGINISRIESRPLKGRFGEYRFFLDLDGHIAEQRVGDALTALHRYCHDLRFLGSYPRADHHPTPLCDGTTDADYAAATKWLTECRASTDTS